MALQEPCDFHSARPLARPTGPAWWPLRCLLPAVGHSLTLSLPTRFIDMRTSGIGEVLVLRRGDTWGEQHPCPQRGVLRLLFSGELSGEGPGSCPHLELEPPASHVYTALLLTPVRFPLRVSLGPHADAAVPGPRSGWEASERVAVPGSEAPGLALRPLPCPLLTPPGLHPAFHRARAQAAALGSPGPSASSPSPGLLLAPAWGTGETIPQSP